MQLSRLCLSFAHFNHLLYYLLNKPLLYFQCSFAADQEDRNNVVVKVLQLLATLVKFGYYDDAEDVTPLLPPIYTLLDGTKDFPNASTKLKLETTRKCKYASEETLAP